MRYDLCILWSYEYDADYIRFMDESLRQRGLTLLSAHPDQAGMIVDQLQRGEISLTAFHDRETDLTLIDSAPTKPLIDLICSRDIYYINHPLPARKTWDKATMHLELIAHGILTPHTIILPAYDDHPRLERIDLSPIGSPFVIKPAHGGAGEDVTLDAASWDQVCAARQVWKDDKYLLQAYVHPRVIAGREAWFRILYAGGKIFPCWWNRQTHVYTPLARWEESAFDLEALYPLTAQIADVAGIQLFSTEIALSADGKFYVVDYVNDFIDLRPQSNAADGVPDIILRAIADQLTALVESAQKGSSEMQLNGRGDLPLI